MSKIGDTTSVNTADGDDVIRSTVPGTFTVEGGAGNDQYIVTAEGQKLNLVYGSGDTGADNIQIEGELTSDNLLAVRDRNSLKLILNPTKDGQYDFSSATEVVLKDYFVTLPMFDGVTFSSGETLTAAGLTQDIMVEGDDQGNTLYGSADDDTFLGRKGNDTLQGLAGNNTYIYQTGDGSDTIYNQSSTTGINTLALQGIDPTDVLLRRSSDDLVAQVSDGSEIRISCHFHSTDYALDAITFDNGIRWESADIDAAVILPSDGDDYIVGGPNGDTLSGDGGDDTIKGQGGMILS